MIDDMNRQEFILEQLLSDKRPVKIPATLEAKIMQNFLQEKDKFNGHYIMVFFRKYNAAFTFLIVMMLGLSLYANKVLIHNNAVISEAEEQALIKLTKEKEYYATANDILSEAASSVDYNNSDDDDGTGDDGSDDDSDYYYDFLQSWNSAPQLS